MKSLVVTFLVFSTSSLLAQKFWIGKSFQVWRGADPSMGFNESSYWENTYKIYSPLMFSSRLEFENGIYVESSLGMRNERLKRRAEIPFSIVNFPDNVVCCSSHIRTSFLLDFGGAFGYTYKLGRFNTSLDLGTYFSKLYYVKIRNIENPYESQQFTINRWVDQEDFMLDLQLAYRISYLIRRQIAIGIEVMGRRRIYTTQHFDLLGRGLNKHPSHRQKYLIGSELSLAYNFWD